MRTACCLLLLSLCVVGLHAAKKFRSEKVNFIYEKALQHVEDRQRLNKLEGELTQYDNLYMATKDLHSESKMGSLNKDLAKVDVKLITLLEKYDLQQTVMAFKEKMKHKNEYQETDDSHDLNTENFTDERLQKLWAAAVAAKFSISELKELHKDLKEAERKSAIYEDALKDLNKVPHENSLHFEETHGLEEKTRRLKEAHTDMHNHYAELKDRVANDATRTSPFESDKVKQMWKLAQANANFTAHDLQVIKEELIHFDKQLKKMAFQKKEIESAREVAGQDKQGKSTLHHVEDAEMDAKHEKMDRKLRKLEKYLQTKVQHSEL